MTLLLIAAIVTAAAGWMVAGWSLMRNGQLQNCVERLLDEAHLAQRLTQIATAPEQPANTLGSMTKRKLSMPINRRLAGLR